MHIISSLEQGGAQAVLYDLVSQLQKKGYTQTIIYMHDGPYYDRFATLGIPLHQINGWVARFDPICLVRLIFHMRAYQPDCVHTVLWAANWLGRIAARFLSIACIVSLHNNYDQNGVVRLLLDQLISYKNCSLIAVSQEVKQSFVGAYQSKTLPPFSVIPNGIDVEKVQDAAKSQKKTRKMLQLSPGDFIIGSVGRFHPIKRYDFLLEAFALLHKKHPQARLILIGTGEQEAFLRDYAEQLQIAPFVRWVIGEAAYGYYPLFDCFVSSSEKEGISIALLEAMSLGCVPIVTNYILQHSVIQHKRNGYVASAYKATDLADKIATCLTRGGRRSRVSKNAQQAVYDSFQGKAMIAAYNRIFRQYSVIKK